MNTNTLKRFAQQARTKLMQQVAAKLDFVLTSDTPELREKWDQIDNLKKELEQSSRKEVVEKVAYTWFNRLMALRFMDANDYQPTGTRVISPIDGYTLPESLSEAKQGNIPEDLQIDRKKVMDLLDGRLESQNPQNEAFKLLLVASCNHLSSILPFLFERIEDYTELLLPDDLTSEFSIVQEVITGMSVEDCQEVEVIGWLYQFYISERKDELINAKKKYKADEIAPVTQLFTPKWIVQYMVDNTLGQYWKEARTDSSITDSLEFYITPADSDLIPNRSVTSPEEITFFDPCCGSGHVLSYAFDLLYRIYEEEGYSNSEIPALILEKNLYGIDIDERAAQLASFSLMMKARQYHRRFFRKPIHPNIIALSNIKDDELFDNAKVLGSLIKVNDNDVAKIKVENSSLFGEIQMKHRKQAEFLARKYDIVVTNPPYLNSSYMESSMKKYVEKEYQNTKSDLFACFVIQAQNLTKPEGFIGFISPYVWMFISSYEKLRAEVITKSTISSLIQLEYNAFEPACVPIATFTLRNSVIDNYKGSYIKLSDFKGHESQAPKTLEAIQNPQCGWYHTATQKDFEKIPGSPIGYWVSPEFQNIFPKYNSLKDEVDCIQGIITGDTNRYLKFWQEIEKDKLSIHNSIFNPNEYWISYTKGGAERKWYGNNNHVINWKNGGNDLVRSRNTNSNFYLKPCITWTLITSASFTARYCPNGFLWDVAGSIGFTKSTENINIILGILCSKITDYTLNVLNPTINTNIENVEAIPIPNIDTEIRKKIETLVSDCLFIAHKEWDSKEMSWDFLQNDFLKIKGQDLEETYDLYQEYWKNKFFQLHKNEEELNRQFIEIYALQEELTPDVPLKNITILKEETKIENGELVFKAKEVMAQFVSYAVGCMFGRYSLDKEGLILANQGETLEDYWQKLGANPQSLAPNTYVPDDDNIIPILEDEWFEDDIAGRFKEFLKVSFGAENFEKNLTFLEDFLGKDIRKYFVKDFYADHIKRYKKRPIYWMFSSPKGAFNVLIYMHRYTPDTLSNILNGYLREYQDKLKTSRENWVHLQISGSAAEKNKAVKELDKIDKTLLELNEYEREVLYPLATDRISIDLDDGVLVNYNKFGQAIKPVAGLNDAKTKKKVRAFDWIDVEEIR